MQDSRNDKTSLVLDRDVEFQLIDRFCYLDDMISAGGGAKMTSRMRVTCALNKFRELSPIQTSRRA